MVAYSFCKKERHVMKYLLLITTLTKKKERVVVFSCGSYAGASVAYP